MCCVLGPATNKVRCLDPATPEPTYRGTLDDLRVLLQSGVLNPACPEPRRRVEGREVNMTSDWG
jgi:hypothetical protein